MWWTVVVVGGSGFEAAAEERRSRSQHSTAQQRAAAAPANGSNSWAAWDAGRRASQISASSAATTGCRSLSPKRHSGGSPCRRVFLRNQPPPSHPLQGYRECFGQSNELRHVSRPMLDRGQCSCAPTRPKCARRQLAFARCRLRLFSPRQAFEARTPFAAYQSHLLHTNSRTPRNHHYQSIEQLSSRAGICIAWMCGPV